MSGLARRNTIAPRVKTTSTMPPGMSRYWMPPMIVAAVGAPGSITA